MQIQRQIQRHTDERMMRNAEDQIKAPVLPLSSTLYIYAYIMCTHMHVYF